MSARTAALRTASAAVVAAAIAGTVLMPMTASATEGNYKALKTTMSAPVPSGPLTRGGATETFDLTVTNTTDKPSAYHPWMLLDHTGSSPLQQSDVVYKVEAVSAPATESAIGQQDGEWQGLFYPAGDKASDGFEIPAKGTMVWKITIGLGKSYPTLNGDFKLRASTFANELADGGEGSLSFKTSPVSKPGTLETWFDHVSPCADGASPDCQEMDVRYRVTGDGEFNSGLGTWIQVDMPDLAEADLRARVKVDGAWKDLEGETGNFNLPVIAKGFGAASGDHITRMQIKLGPAAQLKKLTPVKVTASVGLAEGNTYPFLSAGQQFELGPKTTTPPTSPTPTPPASPAPTSPAPTDPAPTTPAPTAPATTAPAATTTPATGNSPKPTGSLARTGSDSNTALYSGLAAVLIGLGGAAAWFTRRRRTVRG